MKSIDRHDPIPMPNVCHLPDPHLFSLQTTFKRQNSDFMTSCIHVKYATGKDYVTCMNVFKYYKIPTRHGFKIYSFLPMHKMHLNNYRANTVEEDRAYLLSSLLAPNPPPLSSPKI
jgi:hypothetical protein